MDCKQAGQVGGRVKSEAKARAARLNGRLGGRPRIRKTTDTNVANGQKIVVANPRA